MPRWPTGHGAHGCRDRLPPDVVRRRRRVFAFQLNNSALAQLEYALAHGLPAEERELFVAELIEALVAIYSAPISERTIEIASTLPPRNSRARTKPR